MPGVGRERQIAGIGHIMSITTGVLTLRVSPASGHR